MNASAPGLPGGEPAAAVARAAAATHETRILRALAGLDARVEPVLTVPAVRIGDRVVARILDGALLLAPSDARIPPVPAGVVAEEVRPWRGAQPHLRIPLDALLPAPAVLDPADTAAAGPDGAAAASGTGSDGADAASDAATDDGEGAAWLRAAVVATAARVPAVRLPEPPAREPHPRRPRT